MKQNYKQMYEEEHHDRIGWIVLTFVFIGLFFVSLIYPENYDQGYSAGQNATLNKYDCYNKSNFVPSKYSNLTLEPQMVGWNCVGNYTTKINSTFIGCIKK